jgi:GNAT superfamily N-acetyltransferase
MMPPSRPGVDDDAVEISSDRARLDLPLVHGWLTRSYWSPGIPPSTLQRAIEHSICFGVYCEGRQVGFARVITDRATFGYLADVFILEPWQGHGLSRRLMKAVMAHPDLQGLRRFMLATRDAHGLYRKFGFDAPASPASLMEILDPDVYRRATPER